MKLKFTKMHGLGNDFILIDAISQNCMLTTAQVQLLASRQFGIGFDQLLVLKKNKSPEADFLYEIYNADGSQAEQCGNGVRCVARYVIEQRLTEKHELVMEAKAGLMSVSVSSFDHITVNMSSPIFEPKQIPFVRAESHPTYSLHLFEIEQTIMAVSMGNPHAIVVVDDIEHCDFDTLGPRIAKHPDFPQGVNVEFMQVINQQEVALRVYERGVGETLACGSGACAAVVAGVLNGLLDQKVRVRLKGGCLKIEWQGGKSPVMMTGPAVNVFDGVIDLG